MNPDDPYFDRNPGPDPGPDAETAALLRGVLRRQAEKVTPSADGLARILAAAHAADTRPASITPVAPRTPQPPEAVEPVEAAGDGPTPTGSIPIERRPLSLADARERRRPGRWSSVLSAAAAVLVVTAGFGLARLGAVHGLLNAASHAKPMVANQPSAPAIEPLPVYLVERQQGHWALVREFSPTTLTSPNERLTAAVRLAVTGVGTDPDHTSAWRAAGLATSAAAQVTVTRAADALVVRLPAGLLGTRPPNADAVPPGLAVQQLVWTATAAAQSSVPVRVEGPATGGLLFGSYPLGQRVSRDADDPRAPVWVSSLVDGQPLKVGTAVIKGDAVTSSTGTVYWRLFDESGGQVAVGSSPLHTTAGSTPRLEYRGEWEATVTLSAPGRYRFEVSQSWPGTRMPDDPTWMSVPWVDTKTLVVS
jgi:hypothetical protein